MIRRCRNAIRQVGGAIEQFLRRVRPALFSPWSKAEASRASVFFLKPWTVPGCPTAHSSCWDRTCSRSRSSLPLHSAMAAAQCSSLLAARPGLFCSRLQVGRGLPACLSRLPWETRAARAFLPRPPPQSGPGRPRMCVDRKPGAGPRPRRPASSRAGARPCSQPAPRGAAAWRSAPTPSAATPPPRSGCPARPACRPSSTTTAAAGAAAAGTAARLCATLRSTPSSSASTAWWTAAAPAASLTAAGAAAAAAAVS